MTSVFEMESDWSLTRYASSAPVQSVMLTKAVHWMPLPQEVYENSDSHNLTHVNSTLRNENTDFLLD